MGIAVVRWAAAAVLMVLCTVAAAAGMWKTDSFADFRRGTLADGGANCYVSADGSVRLIGSWDFNGDGAFDIPVTCPQDYTETPDLYVYLAGNGGFSPQRRLFLPGDGCVAGASADLNKDGFTDLIVCNRFDGEKDNLDSYVYWGGKDGLSAKRRTGLPSEAAMGAAVGDLNSDGWPDIVFANAGCDYHMTIDRIQKSFVYFGSRRGFSRSRRMELKTVNGTSVAIADLNADNHLDIVFSMEGNGPDDGGAVIYWGDGKGRFRASQFLPGLASSDIAVADLNADGNPDIVLANRARMGAKPPLPTHDNIENYAVDSYIYWGGKEGYSVSARAELPTNSASGCAISDLNNDGLPDVVFSNGRGTLMFGSGAQTSHVYWNNPQGFSSSNKTELPTSSAQDCAAEDLNGDGWPDLVFANLQQGGDLNIDSVVYWGAEDGFSPDRKASLPTNGGFGVVIGDFSADGHTDIAFLNKREGTTASPDYFTYMGDSNGTHSVSRRVSLSAGGGDAFAIADFNADGYSDLLYPNYDGLVYWGSRKGLSINSKTTYKMPHYGYTAAPSDFDRDGYLDIALSGQGLSAVYGGADGFTGRSANLGIDTGGYGFVTVADLDSDGWTDILSTAVDSVAICWNSESGFDPKHVTRLPMDRTDGIRVADLNRDGDLDIVAISELIPNTMPAGNHRPLYLGDPNTKMLIFWGKDGDYSASRSTALPTVGAGDLTISDLNSDGLLDIAVTSYHAGDHRRHPGYIYWNSARGFSKSRRTSFPNASGCGILAADINSDGYRELVWANHTIVGNHRAYVSVAYGSAKGPNFAKATKLPALGPHYFSCADIGNVYDRSGRYDYISEPYDAGEGGSLKRISWEANTRLGGSVEMQTRTAATKGGLERAKWMDPRGAQPSGNRWIQYKATLVADKAGSAPVLRSVTVEYVSYAD